jgi:predicted SAM-dependent methyltransferase
MYLDKKGTLSLLKSKEKIVIELGVGQMRRVPESITIDKLDFPEVDIVADLEEGLTFLPDGSVDEIHSYHFLEHVSNLEFCMKEIFRVLKKGGKKIGVVPHFANPYFYSDYTHSHFFGLYTFSYFSKSIYFDRKVPNFYQDIDFKINSIVLDFHSPFKIRNVFKKAAGLIFNSSRYLQEFHEENWCYLIPAYQIKFELEK